MIKKPPHPATIVQRRASPAGPGAARPPHPATIAQRRAPQAGPGAARPPHPATVAQRRAAKAPWIVQRADSASDPLKSAQFAVRFVKTIIVWGAGNVKQSVLNSEGRSILAFEQGKEMSNNRGWRMTCRAFKTPIEKIFARAALPVKSGGGNCQEHADLTFMWLYENTTGLTLNYACGEDHAFVIIGDPGDKGSWLVVDPWPNQPRIGAYDVACQKVKIWEVEGVSDRGELQSAQAAYITSLQALPQPETPAEELPKKGGYEKDAERAYNVN